MILITGASKGIGKYLFDRMERAYGTYNGTWPDSEQHMTRVDLQYPAMIKTWIESLYMTKVVLINNAGINHNAFAHKANLSKWLSCSGSLKGQLIL